MSTKGKLSLQEVFSTVAVHLLRQGIRSMSPGEGCRYRGPNGMMCAVGKLIKDDEYSLSIENHTVTSMDVLEALRASGVDTYEQRTVMLLSQLQQLHDRVLPSLWREGLSDTAKRFSLSMPDTDTLLARCTAALTEPTACFINETKEEALA